MTLWLSNLAAYSAQLAALVAAAVVVDLAAALPPAAPGAGLLADAPGDRPAAAR